MAYRHRVQTYQRIRTVILRDVWLIDHDHKEDEKEDGVEEEASDAACLTGRAGSLQTAVDRFRQPDSHSDDQGRFITRGLQFLPPTAEQSGRSHQSDNQDRGSGSTMPRWARHQRRTSGVAGSTTGAAEPRLAAPDADG